MSALVKREHAPISADILEKVLITGDLSKLNEKQRVEYYGAVCRSVGLNPLTKPFEYISLNNKLVLYAVRACTDQLRAIHKVSVTVSSREKIDDVYVVTARAKYPDGREDESTGAVNVAGLKGEALANAFMKAETKAKRRVTLSICGLSLLDETEVETIPGAKTVDLNPPKDALADIRKEREVVEQDPGEYVINFGKWNNKKIKDLDPYEVANYVQFIEDKAQHDGKPLQGKVFDFIQAANRFLTAKMERPAVMGDWPMK